MKPNLILLHGALGSQSQFKTLQEHLSDHFTVHTLNFSGHGGQPFDGDYGMEKFAEEVLQMMDKNEIAHSHIFGYSMGGYVALVFAKKYPERVGKIMTLGTKFDWNPEGAALEVKMLNAEKIEAKVPHFAKMLEKRHHPLDWKSVLQATGQMMLELGNGKALPMADFGEIAHEVTIHRGEKDKMVNAQESQAVAKILPNGHFTEVPDFPHPIEQVDMVQLGELIHSNILGNQ